MFISVMRYVTFGQSEAHAVTDMCIVFLFLLGSIQGC